MIALCGRSVGEPDSLNANQCLQTCLKFSPLGDLTEVWAGPTTANAAPNTDGTCDFGAPGLKRQLSQSFDDFGQLELLGGANPLAPNRMIINSWRVFSASSEGDDYAASTQSFDGWGNVTQGLQGVPSFGFTGREPDSSGLTYYRARYYHPGIGRFISRDPIGLAGGINGYAYVNNSPVNLVDPSGQFGEVAVSGNNVNITIPIRFTGIAYSDAVANRYSRDIEKRLSGSYEFAGSNFNATTRVQQLGFFESLLTPDSKQNIISITALRPSDRREANVSCASGGACTGNWPAIMSGLQGVGAHEALHLLGLSDDNVVINGISVPLPGSEGDLTATRLGKFSGFDVAQIIKNSLEGFKNAPRGTDAVGGRYIDQSSNNSSSTQKGYGK